MMMTGPAQERSTQSRVKKKKKYTTKKQLVTRRETGPDRYDHQSRCRWRFRLSTERTSEVNLERECKHSKGNLLKQQHKT